MKLIKFSKKLLLVAWNYRHSYQLILLSLTLLGLLLRLWLAWSTNQTLPNTSARLVGDETGYDGLAWGLLNGSFFEWPGRTPIYPIFLAICYAIFGHSYATVLYIQAFIGATVIPLTFLLARRFTGAISSLVAAALIALHPSLILHVARLYSEIIFTPLLLLTILSLLWGFEKPSIKRFILSGVLIAITNLCRPTAVLFPAIVFLMMPWVWSLKCRIRLFIAYISAIIIVTAPWVYHNYQTHHAFLPYSVSVGMLWQGSPEFYHLVTDQKRNLLQIWDEQLNSERNGGHDPFSIEGDRYFTKRAIASIKAEPGLYARYCLQKAAYLWIGNPVIDWPGQAIFSVKALRPYFSPQRIVGIFFARLLPLVAIVALIILRRDLLKFLPLLAFCAYFTVIHGITYSEVRYSEPLYPIIVTIIATAAGEIQRRYEAAVKYS